MLNREKPSLLKGSVRTEHRTPLGPHHAGTGPAAPCCLLAPDLWLLPHHRNTACSSPATPGLPRQPDAAVGRMQVLRCCQETPLCGAHEGNWCRCKWRRRSLSELGLIPIAAPWLPVHAGPVPCPPGNTSPWSWTCSAHTPRNLHSSPSRWLPPASPLSPKTRAPFLTSPSDEDKTIPGSLRAMLQ